MKFRNPFILLFFLILLFSCRKKNNTNAECVSLAITPLQPYSFPVWHPSGQLLGFNYIPLAGISANDSPPCTWYYYAGKQDSAGFYLMNRDGTGFKRVTNFKLGAPSWSPDGKWIAFSFGPTIYKMPFNGITFDTTQILPLTTSGANFFPSWTANSDTIYFNSNNNAPQGTAFYSIWKMASDGSGKTLISQLPNYGEMPFVGSNNKIYYVGEALGQLEIFSINKDGSNQIQLTFKSNTNASIIKYYPRHFNGKTFYQQNGLWSVSINENPVKLEIACDTYDISVTGEIVYSKTDYNINKYNKQIGTLWIMNSDGSNKKQLTFNNF